MKAQSIGIAKKGQLVLNSGFTAFSFLNILLKLPKYVKIGENKLKMSKYVKIGKIT